MVAQLMTKPVVGSASDLMGDGAIGIPEATEFSGLKRSFLYSLMCSGKLAYTTVGRRRLIPRRALVELLNSGLVSANRS